MKIAATILFSVAIHGAAVANTYFKPYEAEVHTAAGGQYLLRLDVPTIGSLAKETLEVPATIFTFSPKTRSYIKSGAFVIKCTRFPQKVLIAPEGDRVIVINRDMDRTGRSEVVQVFDGHGKKLKEFALGDIYRKEDVAAYWTHDERDGGVWLEEAYLTDKRQVYFKCRDVLGDFRLHDYLLDLATLKGPFSPNEKAQPAATANAGKPAWLSFNDRRKILACRLGHLAPRSLVRVKDEA